MTGTDIVLAILAFLSMAATNLVLVYFVPDPALTSVILFGLGLLFYDFWQQFRSGRRNG